MTRQWGELYPDCYGHGQSPINLTPGVETKVPVSVNSVSHSTLNIMVMLTLRSPGFIAGSIDPKALRMAW